MQRSRSETVTLDDILITEEISRRSPRPPNWQAEAQAMLPLARQMVRDSESLLQTLVEIALELCQAGTAGVSLLETSDGEEVFRWSELAGRFTHDGLIPRDFSPCGVCVDRGTPQLFSHPERYFTYLQDANTPIVEALLLPLIADDRAIGAIWIMSHDEQRHFDAEDVRVMTSLADFTAAALLLKQQQTRELLAVNAALEVKVEEHRQAEDRARALISNLPGGAAFVVDRDLRYLLAEGEALSAAGFKPEDFIGQTIFEVLPPELTTNYEILYRKALAGESFEYEHNAHERSYISRGTPLRSVNGEVYAVLAVSYDISDRKIAEAAIAADFKDTQLLRDLSARLTTEGDIQVIYNEIVATAIALTRADAGSIQILEVATQDLLLLATQGFERDLTDRFYRVDASSNTSCGRALVTGDRTFVDFDVPESEDPHGSMRLHVEAGYLSAQSTPLIARSGKAIGMVSTHWCKHHRPSDRELRFLDLLVRQAADLLEQRQAQAALRESEAHFRAFVNASSDIVYRMSADWSVMHNLDGKQFIASTTDPKRTWLDEYIPEDEQPQVWATIESAIQTKSNFELEHRVFREDGTIGWTFSRAIPLLNQQGEIIEWFGAASDISDRKLREAALRESEEKYRTLFDSMDEGYILVDVIFDENDQPIDILYLEANPAAVKMMGTELVGRRTLEINSNFESHWFETFGRVARTGIGERHEFYTAPLDVWYNFYVFKVGEPNETRVAAVYQDVSDRKRREANLALLAQIAEDSSRLASEEAIMKSTGERLATHLRLDGFNFSYVDERHESVTIKYSWNAADVPQLLGTFRFAEYMTEESTRTMRAGETWVVCDTQHDERTDAQATAAIDVAAVIVVPYHWRGEWQGCLTVTCREVREWTVDEIALIVEVSNRTFPRLERARAEEDLRESEVKYRSLFTSIDEGYALCEVMYDENEKPVDLRYLEVNPAFEQLSGLENAVGKTAVELNPILESFWLEAIDRVIQTGVATRVEDYAEGLNRWIDIYFSRVGGEGSRQIAVVFNDITDRKRTEAQLRRAAEMDAFRVKLSDALRSLSDSVEIQMTASRVLREHLGAIRICYFEAFDQTEEVSATAEDLIADAPPFVGHTYRFTDFEPAAIVEARTGRTTWRDDVTTDESLSLEQQSAYAMTQTRAWVLAPLVKKGRFVACLVAYFNEPHPWTPDEIALLEETAERTWAAVERARAEAAMRELELQRIRESAVREEERQQAETLAELDRAKTTFFSNVSHEFRTPLTLLLAPLQDALSDRTHPLASAHRERLELAHRNANRLLKLVNTLLDFSRIEVGRMEAVYEPTDLAMFTTELASVFRSAIERAGLRLIVDCPPLPEPVYVDREMWEKIVLNLLSNALKFTLEGEIAVRLHRADGECAQRNGRAERVRLQIQDTGTGIAPEELPHLFERFYQVRGAQARTHEGSGIGLALVHELIRLHVGSVDVSSVVGQGTCFTVTIPLGTAHLSSDRLRLDVGDSPSETLRERNTTQRTQASTAIGAASYVEEAERWLPADSAPPQPPDLRGENIVKVPLAKGNLGESLGLQTDATFPSARILLVDDNADMRDYLTRILSEYVQVEAVADGATALAAVQERAPNLVLSDVMMPGLDGFALLKALRADPPTREIPIILLSARAGEESIVEGLEAGADDYLIKPFSAAELVSRVNAHLQMAQLRGEALRQERTTSRRKDELLSTVSHELNTPLVAILGWTRLLRGSPPSQSMLMKSLETIERNATLQAKLIQDLLDISRITAGKVRLSLQPVELQSVIENAIAAVKTAAIAKDIHLQWQPTDRNPSVTVLGDRDRLQQTICNLLTNAIKFTPESGSITVQLVVKESWESKVAEIGITDTGIGIATDFLPHVFDRFRQAEGADSAKGLGLGLAIARHLVELHNGTIHAESSGAGLGATFTVKLPILQE
ncbi:ATP-binding protein [Chroococcidiopsis sp. CCNUC1]|uniref:ATP-binding protein n=1 Tax=Chroococcidiopsis sp. CCNUC1 TaxID=2653189 RepID=UPI0020215932|nr:ATP-binding protein [Chroococcidiopsis sp. CCNUC1]URD52427.1 ATP-binding protein [Chroococcidiopsis sp. CCNUC1]